MTRYNEVMTQLPQVMSPLLPDHPPYTIADRPKKEKVKKTKKEAKGIDRKQSASPTSRVSLNDLELVNRVEYTLAVALMSLPKSSR